MNQTNPQSSQKKYFEVSKLYACILNLLCWDSIFFTGPQYKGFCCTRVSGHGRCFLAANASLSVKKSDVSIYFQSQEIFFFLSLKKRKGKLEPQISKCVQTRNCSRKKNFFRIHINSLYLFHLEQKHKLVLSFVNFLLYFCIRHLLCINFRRLVFRFP